MTATRSINMTPVWVFLVSSLAIFLAISSYGRYRVHAHTAKHDEAERVIRTCMPTDAMDRITFGDPSNPFAMVVGCYLADKKAWGIVIISGSLILSAYYLKGVATKRQAIKRVEENKEYNWRLDK